MNCEKLQTNYWPRLLRPVYISLLMTDCLNVKEALYFKIEGQTYIYIYIYIAEIPRALPPAPYQPCLHPAPCRTRVLCTRPKPHPQSRDPQPHVLPSSRRVARTRAPCTRPKPHPPPRGPSNKADLERPVIAADQNAYLGPFLERLQGRPWRPSPWRPSPWRPSPWRWQPSSSILSLPRRIEFRAGRGGLSGSS